MEPGTAAGPLVLIIAGVMRGPCLAIPCIVQSPSSRFAQSVPGSNPFNRSQPARQGGITFMDNAWDYHDGRSEEWMGEALQGRRDQVFLMTKVCSHGRDGKVALRQLEQSLRRLKTDHLDLWQIHEVVYETDPALHFAR